MRRPSSDSSPVTNTEPTPAFRRFPWVQLVFCIACLAMTAWTWMRYSYAWEVTARSVAEREMTLDNLGRPGPLLCIRANVVEHEVVKSWSWFENCAVASLVLDDGAGGVVHLYAAVPEESKIIADKQLVLAGRIFWSFPAPDASAVFYLDATVSRFHPTSVAGLVVGAMGLFIFTLYLRSWLRERNALACEPVQDMIV